MATKKNTPKKTATEKTTIIKMAEKVGEIAGEISVKKDQIVKKATDAIESVRSTLHNITAPKKPAVKKLVKRAKKAAKKVAKPAVKKVAGAKKEIRKVVKKAATAKKTVRKVVKKAAKKITGKKR